MSEGLPKADVYFILLHRETGIEIKMPVFSICEEYSTIAFSTDERDYNGQYNNIGALPSYDRERDEKASGYDVYVVINGVKHIYDGLFYNDKYGTCIGKHRK
jgi:hypothetical protein